MSLTWESELLLGWFRIEVLSVCQPSCQFELEWVTDSSSEAESHKNWPHVTMCHWSHVICWLHAHFLFTLLYQLLMTLKHLHYEKRAFPVNAQETLPWNSYYPSAVFVFFRGWKVSQQSTERTRRILAKQQKSRKTSRRTDTKTFCPVSLFKCIKIQQFYSFLH